MSEEATEETEKAVTPNDSPRRKSCTTDGFLAPSGELDFDLPVQRDLSGLIRYVQYFMFVSPCIADKLRRNLTSA